MNNSLAVVGSPFSFADMERLAESIAKSRLFGIQTPDQALTLMAISQAEGRHPALAARDYDIIQGRPAKKAEAMQRDFLAAGGKIEWHALSDTTADATFSHPMGGSVRINWDNERAKQAGLGGKDNWRKFPRAMLRARVVSEGVRTVFPAATSGMYVPEEVSDFRAPIDVTPAKDVERQVDEWRAEREAPPPKPEFADVGLELDNLVSQGNAFCHDTELLQRWWTKHLSAEQRGVLGAKGRGVGPYLTGWKEGKAWRVGTRLGEHAEPAGGSEHAISTDDSHTQSATGDPIEDLFEQTILKAVYAAPDLATVEGIEAIHKRQLEGMDHEEWLPLQAKIDARKIALQRQEGLT